jgi:hypothetical protein
MLQKKMLQIKLSSERGRSTLCGQEDQRDLAFFHTFLPRHSAGILPGILPGFFRHFATLSPDILPGILPGILPRIFCKLEFSLQKVNACCVSGQRHESF